MSIPFDPKELEIKRRAMSFNPNVPGTALFDFPVSEREALLSLYNKGEAVWLPYGVESGLFCPSVIPDNIARGFVFEAQRWPEPYTTHDDMFGVNWTYVPTVGGSMETPGIPHPFDDVNDWKEKLKIPDPYAWDWDASAKMNNDYLKNNGKANMFWFLNGATFERLISFMGFENAAMAMIDEDQQDALKALFAKTTKLYMDIVDKYAEYFPEVDALNVHDDWGSQKSPFFSQDTAMEMIVPFMKQLTDHIKSKGFIADMHSCGHNDSRIEAYIAGGWQSWTPQPMNDTEKLFQEYGDKIIITVDLVLPLDLTEEQQRDAAKRFVETHCVPGKKLKVTVDTHLAAFEKELYKQSRLAYLSF